MRNLFIILVCFSFCTSKQKQANQSFKKEAINLKQDTLKYYVSFDIHTMQPVGKPLTGEIYQRCLTFEKKQDTIILNMYPDGMYGNIQERVYVKTGNEYICHHKVDDAGFIHEIQEFINTNRVFSFQHFISYNTKERILLKATQVKVNNSKSVYLRFKKNRDTIKVKPYKSIVEFMLEYGFSDSDVREFIITTLKGTKAKESIKDTDNSVLSHTIDDYDYFWDLYLRIWSL